MIVFAYRHAFSQVNKLADLCVSYLNGAVVLARRLTAHVACVAAARAALHLHTGRPYQEVSGRGIHLAPGDLVDHRPRLTHRRDRLLYWKKDKGGGGVKLMWSACVSAQ